MRMNRLEKNILEAHCIDEKKSPTHDTVESDKIVAQIEKLTKEISDLSFHEKSENKDLNKNITLEESQSTSLSSLPPIDFEELFTITPTNYNQMPSVSADNKTFSTQSQINADNKIKEFEESSEEFYSDGCCKSDCSSSNDSENDEVGNFNENFLNVSEELTLPEKNLKQKVPNKDLKMFLAKTDQKTNEMQTILKILQEETERINGFIKNEKKEEISKVESKKHNSKAQNILRNSQNDEVKHDEKQNDGQSTEDDGDYTDLGEIGETIRKKETEKLSPENEEKVLSDATAKEKVYSCFKEFSEHEPQPKTEENKNLFLQEPVKEVLREKSFKKTEEVLKTNADEQIDEYKSDESDHLLDSKGEESNLQELISESESSDEENVKKAVATESKISKKEERKITQEEKNDLGQEEEDTEKQKFDVGKNFWVWAFALL